jgi:hypothetical protein
VTVNQGAGQQQEALFAAPSICTLPAFARRQQPPSRHAGLHQRRLQPAQSCHGRPCRIIHRSTLFSWRCGGARCRCLLQPCPWPYNATVFPFARHMAVSAPHAAPVIPQQAAPSRDALRHPRWRFLQQHCGAAQSDAAYMHANHPHPGRTPRRGHARIHASTPCKHGASSLQAQTTPKRRADNRRVGACQNPLC